MGIGVEGDLVRGHSAENTLRPLRVFTKFFLIVFGIFAHAGPLYPVVLLQHHSLKCRFTIYNSYHQKNTNGQQVGSQRFQVEFHFVLL
jgi:hypothetical protein